MKALNCLNYFLFSLLLLFYCASAKQGATIDVEHKTKDATSTQSSYPANVDASDLRMLEVRAKLLYDLIEILDISYDERKKETLLESGQIYFPFHDASLSGIHQNRLYQLKIAKNGQYECEALGHFIQLRKSMDAEKYKDFEFSNCNDATLAKKINLVADAVLAGITVGNSLGMATQTYHIVPVEELSMIKVYFIPIFPFKDKAFLGGGFHLLYDKKSKEISKPFYHHQKIHEFPLPENQIVDKSFIGTVHKTVMTKLPSELDVLFILSNPILAPHVVVTDMEGLFFISSDGKVQFVPEKAIKELSPH